MIELIKPNQPDRVKLNAYLDGILERGFYTNNGPLVKELEAELSSRLFNQHFLLTANGTLSLQLALKAFSGSGEVVVTPYSYVATTNAAHWQGNKLRFIDVADGSFFPDPNRLEETITKQTRAILLTHVYGLVGPIEDYEAIAQVKNIPLIFDAAHAFGVKWKGQPVDRFGEVSSYSFHATKTFHTAEGGGLSVRENDRFQQLFNYRSFGHRGDEYLDIGINAKNSEIHAAIGLAQLDSLPQFLARRIQVFNKYQTELNLSGVDIINLPVELEWNYGYFPLIFNSEVQRAEFERHMLDHKIMARRYFFPSLNRLRHYQSSTVCSNAESLASRVVCIPMHGQLSDLEVDKIISICNAYLNK